MRACLPKDMIALNITYPTDDESSSLKQSSKNPKNLCLPFCLDTEFIFESSIGGIEPEPLVIFNNLTLTQDIMGDPA